MRVLVDIVHPADVLFFLNPIRALKTLGHQVCIASRHKDVTEELLLAFGLEHRTLSTAGSGLPRLGLELLQRDLAMLSLVRDFQPHVMVGFGGISISHAGKLTGTPAISFYDTERASLQHRITLPFLTHLYVPDSYTGPTAKNRTTRSDWNKEFSYLHPHNFSPDKAVAEAAGLAADSKNFFLRLVGWQASHDLGKTGWREDTLRAFVTHLAARGRVHISSERRLPEDLQAFQYTGSAHQVHHLLAYCDSYIGESATMASEAVLLGIPALYATSDRRGYTDQLAGKNLLWQITDVGTDALTQAFNEIEALDRREWARRVQQYRSGKINAAQLVVEATLRHGAPDTY